MSILQRPSDAMAQLFWRLPPSPLPINTQIVVGDQECVVATLNGAMLGVIPTGSHWLHPQPFPFLVSSIDSQSNIRAELWFVLTSVLRGIQCGGSLGSFHDEQTSVECSPRAFLEISIQATDPTRLVNAVMGQSQDVDAMLAYIKARVMNAAKTIVGENVAGGMSVMSPKLSQQVTERLPHETDLGGMVAVVTVHSVMINFSDEDRQALTKAAAAKAQARMAAMQAAQAPQPAAASAPCGHCGAPGGGGRFCTACGGPLHA